MVHDCIPNNIEMEIGGSEIQGYSRLYSEVWTTCYPVRKKKIQVLNFYSIEMKTLTNNILKYVCSHFIMAKHFLLFFCCMTNQDWSKELGSTHGSSVVVISREFCSLENIFCVYMCVNRRYMKTVFSNYLSFSQVRFMTSTGKICVESPWCQFLDGNGKCCFQL